MKKSSALLTTLLMAGLLVLATTSARRPSNFRLLYWNIQNGMWDGQSDHYGRFVNWVKARRPDVCVWCEASTIYYEGTDKVMPKEERYLPDHRPIIVDFSL